MTTDATTEAAGVVVSRLSEEPGTIHLKVEASVDRVRAAELTAAKLIAKRARLPGFRKGKVPIHVVKRQFRAALQDEVLRALIAESWKLALEQEALKPIGDPRVSNVSFEDQAPLTFELHVDVRPEIELSRLGGFQLTKRGAKVTEAQVDEQLEELRRQRAPWVPVEEGSPGLGHLASISIATRDAGDQESEARPYQIVLGEGQAIPDLEERVLTMQIGETSETTVRYPDDFADESKRGQTRSVRITLHELKRQDLPVLDDGFATEVGEFKDLTALRNALREDLEAGADRDATSELRRQLIDQIIEANELEAPRSLVRRVLSGFAQAYEVPDERLEEFAKEFGPIAARQVQRDLILDYVAGREKLAATEAELDERIASIAERRGEQPSAVYASLQKAKRLRELEHSITEEKVFAYLLAQSTITDA